VENFISTPAGDEYIHVIILHPAIAAGSVRYNHAVSYHVVPSHHPATLTIRIKNVHVRSYTKNELRLCVWY